ncbi:MAG: nucleoside monophosphate kinase [bacterium]|nr:nucleoside monophosphate kinase [bacterium]
MLGPQGSGKGTQARLLAAELGVPVVAPGKMFRQEIARDTALGRRVAPMIERGEMVPNAITNTMVRERLAQSDTAGGYILDGYPRDREELEAYDGFAEPFTHVVLLDLDDATAVERLAHRWICICGAPHSDRELTLSQGAEAACAACDGTLVHRSDDEPDAIRRRLRTYHAETKPVLVEARARGVLVEIDGSGTIDEVFGVVKNALGL